VAKGADEMEKLRRWLPALLWMGLIFFLSSQPKLPRHPDDVVDFIIKKTGHMMEYGILAFLIWRALAMGGSLSPLVKAFLLSLLYAASDEYHQSFVPGRDGNPFDVCVDAIGALMALIFVWRLRAKKHL
jgi:VanZ family protein